MLMMNTMIDNFFRRSLKKIVNYNYNHLANQPAILYILFSIDETSFAKMYDTYGEISKE